MTTSRPDGEQPEPAASSERPFWLPAEPTPPGPAAQETGRESVQETVHEARQEAGPSSAEPQPAPSPWSYPAGTVSRGPYLPAEPDPPVEPSPWAPGPAPGQPSGPAPDLQPAAEWDAGSEPAPYQPDETRPVGVQADPAYPAYPGYWTYPTPPNGPAYPAQPARPNRAGWIIGGIATALVLVLLAALVGGLAGAYLARRGASAPVALPMPSGGSTDRATGSIPAVAAAALPSVVTIEVRGGADGSSGTGSGFVISAEGYVLTNNHVVAEVDSSTSVRIVFSDGTSTSATLRGRDASYDLAVLKIAKSGLRPLTLGDSASVVVGDQVVAVGAPLGLNSTVTSGIVSALDRPVTPGGDSSQSYINAIQTDAAINPGNSGGPLLDMEGRVIGINTAIARIPGASTSGQSGSIGLGFAIPSNQARITADQLIRSGKAQHPIIGVLLDTEYTGPGARVSPTERDGRQPVTAGGPADEAGMEPGDVITAIDGKTVAEAAELVVAIRAKQVGDTVTLTVKRDGAQRTVRLTLQGSSE